jgi:aspartyl-tRNA(Asn)/glutamyl-tRNA(Gln) amidotransferase subunit B
LEISDGNMSQGSMRCDANVSIRKKGDKKLGTRTELKNINSFKFVEKAINFEIKRQISCLEKGEEIVQETRLYDAVNNTTRSMRSKEEANDYRYFPEPDIIPIQITSDQIQKIKNELPELPDEKKERFINELGLSEYDSRNLTYDLELADFFEETLDNIDDPKLVANWILGDFSAILNKFDVEASDSKVDAVKFAELLTYLKEEKISGQATKKVLENIWENPDLSVSKSIQDLGLEQISDDNEIEEIIEKVINNNPDQKEQFLSGKDRLFGFFVGQVMKESKGKANPKLVNEILKKKLV